MHSAKDLSKEAPRSPSERLGGFVILGRTIDKCRAELHGTAGEYHFDCPLDKELFAFIGIDGVEFKKYVAEGHSDTEIVQLVKTTGTMHTDSEIEIWSNGRERENYSNNSEAKKWLECEYARLGIPKNGTLFEYLDADDAAFFVRDRHC